MRALPSALLSLPGAGDRSFDVTLAKVRRIAIEHLLTRSAAGLSPQLARPLPP